MFPAPYVKEIEHRPKWGLSDVTGRENLKKERTENFKKGTLCLWLQVVFC
jgi:hypothetical protein